MIVEIVEIVAGSITIITCSSLWLVGEFDKRERADVVDDVESASVKLYPFCKHDAPMTCVFCGALPKNTGHSDSYGPNIPSVCTKKSCPAHHRPHLHVVCESCKGTWSMLAMSADTCEELKLKEPAENWLTVE